MGALSDGGSVSETELAVVPTKGTGSLICSGWGGPTGWGALASVIPHALQNLFPEGCKRPHCGHLICPGSGLAAAGLAVLTSSGLSCNGGGVPRLSSLTVLLLTWCRPASATPVGAPHDPQNRFPGDSVTPHVAQLAPGSKLLACLISSC
jgi:hypothetical protein